MPSEGSQTRVGNLPTVNKLNGIEDYNNWKFAMKMLLMREKLWQQVRGDEEEFDEEKSMEALTLICLHVEPHIYPHVRNANRGKEAWDALAKVFEDKGINRRIGLIDVLLDEKLEKHKNMHEYIIAIMSAAQKLEDIGQGLDDDLIAVVML